MIQSERAWKLGAGVIGVVTFAFTSFVLILDRNTRAVAILGAFSTLIMLVVVIHSTRPDGQSHGRKQRRNKYD